MYWIRFSMWPMIALALILLVSGPVAAQGAGCDSQRCLYLPAVSKSEAAPSAAGQLVQRIAQAQTDGERYQALLAVMQALGIGVYTTLGQALVVGSERAPGDFYLYDFEVEILARSLGRGDHWDLKDMAELLAQPDLLGEGTTLTPAELQAILHTGTVSASQNPGDRLSLIPLLVRELGLQQPAPYDLLADVPADVLQFDALQRWLILADLLLPIIWEKGPVEVNSSLPVALGGIVRTVDIGPGPQAGAQDPCVDIGNIVKEEWSAGKWALGLVSVAKPILAGAMVSIDALHGPILAYGVDVRALEENIRTHYGHETPGQELRFRILVRMLDELPELFVKCGWLAGVEFPAKGPIPGVRVLWVQAQSELAQHGTFQCGMPCSTLTGADGVATLVFQPKAEPQPGTGLLAEATGVVDGIALYQSKHKNALGAIAQFLTPKYDGVRWTVQYHEQQPWSGTVTISQSGQRVREPTEPGQSGSTTMQVTYEATFKVTGSIFTGPKTYQWQADLTRTGKATKDGVVRKESYGACEAGDPSFLRAWFEDSVAGAWSGTAQGQSYVRITVKDDGSYELSTGAPGLTLPGKQTSHHVFKDACQPAWDYDYTTEDENPVYLSPMDLRVTGQVDTANPNTFAGSFTTSSVSLWDVPVEVTVQWNLSRR